MLNLSTTSDKISVVTSSAADIDVQVSYADFNLGASALGRKNTAIASATTTDITGSPASGYQRNIKHMSVRNKHASTSQTLTFTHFDGSTTVEIYSCVLLAGQILGYDGEDGWKIYGNGTLTLSAQTGLDLSAIPALGLRGLARFAILNNGGQYGLLAGVRSNTGYAWLQAQRVDGTAAAYAIMLNPNGGGVTVGDVLNVGDQTIPTAPTLPTGGTVTTVGNYTVHTFLSGGNFVVPAGMVLPDAEVLVVAGGGGGGPGYAGQGNGGGGGGGQVLPASDIPFVPGTYAVTVGAGGAGGSDNGGLGHVGGSSSIAGVATAVGGGGGAGGIIGTHVDTGGTGASGGGGNGGYGGAGGAATNGNVGGAGAAAAPYAGGGGGGSDSPGSAAGSGTYGNGGAGFESAISGAATRYGGGGGGGSNDPSIGGIGGTGGGGAGRGTGTGSNGTANTGGGGGGGGNGGGAPFNGGSGGSGIVIIRYRTPAADRVRVSRDSSNYLATRVSVVGQVELSAIGTLPFLLFTLNGDTRLLRLTSARAVFYLPMQKPVYTVATLPTGALGDCAMVSDASSPTFGATVAGGGSTKVPVYSDGTNWKVG